MPFKTIKYQLYQGFQDQGGFYALLLKFSCKRKVCEYNNYVRHKMSDTLERAHETERSDPFRLL